MASMNLDVAVKKDWPLANPWTWLAAGLGLTLWSLAWTLYFRPSASDNRIFPLVAGLLAAGVGVWLRQRDASAIYLSAWMPPVAAVSRLAMAALFAALALGATVLLIASLFYPVELDARSGVWTRFIDLCQRTIGLHIGPAVLVWLSLVPLAVGSARRCLKRKDGQGLLEADEERGLAYCLLAGCCFLGSFALLRDPDDAVDWDSMRLFLRAAGVVCLYAAGLTLVSACWRRLIFSLLILLHFAGISSACVSAPPSPWVVQQIWMRLFRPYLEFMYLNNAYHFYAPEPGPSSYLWFRVIFTDQDGVDQGLWYKVPQIDHQGRIQHPVALEYQRYLSMTESIAQTDPLPSELVYDPEKGWMPRPIYLDRLRLAEGPEDTVVIVGLKKQFRIPLHPDILKTQQVNIPADGPRRLLQSFARHVARKYADHPDELGRPMKFKSVKIYRVIHAIPPILFFQGDLPPTDPTLYRPFFVGNYNADGQMIQDGDPYLYWLVPIVRDPRDPDVILDYSRRHAGQQDWKRRAADFDKD